MHLLGADQAKLNTVKRIYEEATRAEKLTEEPQEANVIRRYATDSFAELIARQMQHQPTEYDMDECTESAPRLTQGNGFSLTDKHTSYYSVADNGRAIARLNFSGEPSVMYFDMVCSGNSCKVNDILEEGRNSTRAAIRQYCPAN